MNSIVEPIFNESFVEVLDTDAIQTLPKLFFSFLLFYFIFEREKTNIILNSFLLWKR